MVLFELVTTPCRVGSASAGFIPVRRGIAAVNRSLAGIAIPRQTAMVIVRARDVIHQYGGKEVEVTVKPPLKTDSDGLRGLWPAKPGDEEGGAMEKIVEELKKIFQFKNTTREGDIVLVVTEKPQVMLYGLVSHIERDMSKQDEWWHVTLRMLTMPPQKMIWTLREPQFTGAEIFTMGGEKQFMQAIDFSEAKPGPEKPDAGDQSKKPALRVVK